MTLCFVPDTIFLVEEERIKNKSKVNHGESEKFDSSYHFFSGILFNIQTSASLSETHINPHTHRKSSVTTALVH